jgi:hypothetical protein
MAVLWTIEFTNGIAARMADTFRTCSMHVKLVKPPQRTSDEALLKYLSLTCRPFRAVPSERSCKPNGRQDRRSHSIINRTVTCRLAENSSARRMAAEMVNVVANLLNGEMLVEEAWIWRRSGTPPEKPKMSSR